MIVLLINIWWYVHSTRADIICRRFLLKSLLTPLRSEQESIRRFSDQDELVQRMQSAGFTNARYTNLTGGIVALHEGWKGIS